MLKTQRRERWTEDRGQGSAAKQDRRRSRANLEYRGVESCSSMASETSAIGFLSTARVEVYKRGRQGTTPLRSSSDRRARRDVTLEVCQSTEWYMGVSECIS